GAGHGADLGEEGKISFETARQALGLIAQLLKVIPAEHHESLRTLGKFVTEAFRHNPRLAGMMITILSDQTVEALTGVRDQNEKPAEAWSGRGRRSWRTRSSRRSGPRLTSSGTRPSIRSLRT